MNAEGSVRGPFLADHIFPADLAVVFGITLWERPAARAVELYRSGTVTKLLFTGGFNPAVGAAEAVRMAELARREGVASDAILVEAEATYTQANVLNARRVIDETIGLDAVSSLLLVAIHFHMRRVRIIAEDVFPGRIRIGTASYPSVHYESAEWFLSPRGRADVLSEEKKLAAYLGTPRLGGEGRSA